MDIDCLLKMIGCMVLLEDLEVDSDRLSILGIDKDRVDNLIVTELNNYSDSEILHESIIRLIDL